MGIFMSFSLHTIIYDVYSHTLYSLTICSLLRCFDNVNIGVAFHHHCTDCFVCLGNISYFCRQIVVITGFNSYINGFDLSSQKVYCVNHGQLTQYIKSDYYN